jgi:hypothetical protein
MSRDLYYAELNDGEQYFFIFAESQVDAVTQIFDKEIKDNGSILKIEISVVCEEHEIINLDK